MTVAKTPVQSNTKERKMATNMSGDEVSQSDPSAGLSTDPAIDKTLPIASSTNVVESSSSEADDSDDQSFLLKKKKTKWNREEKEAIFIEFGKEIIEGTCPKRKDIINLKLKKSDILGGRTDPQLCTFVHNLSNRKMKNVTPDVKKTLKKHNINF